MRPGDPHRRTPQPAASVVLLCALLAAAGCAAETHRPDRAGPAPPATRQASDDGVLLRIDPTRPPDRTVWPVRLGVEAGPAGRVLVLAPDPPDTPEARLVSRPLHTRLEDGPVLLELRARPEPRSPSSTLLIELGDAGGTRFRTLGRLDARQAEGPPLRIRIDPPARDWRLRLRVPVGGGRWLVQQLMLRPLAPTNQGTLRVDAMPIRPYQVRAARRDGAVRDLILPARLDPEPGLKLLAPARVGPWVFWRWELDGTPQAPRQRVLLPDPTQAWEAVARYRPAPDTTVTLRVDPAPDPGQSPRVLLDGVPLPGTAAAGTFELLAGEQVMVEAPPRTARALLDHWELDGSVVEAAGSRLVLQVTADTHVLAAYVLLGDMNGDGRVDRDDVDVFVLALADPDAYARQFPGLDRVARGDMNGDGVLDWADVERFVDQVLRTGP